MKGAFSITTDKSEIDYKAVHRFLSKDSYWAQGRSMETIQKSIENSLCFSAFIGKEFIGFARVITDYSVFAWIMDLFILPDHRGKGLGQKLIKAIVDHESLQNLQRWGLNTTDAHSLYEKFGFKRVKNPKIHMEKTAKPF